jgi:hypothetical protein
VAAITVRLHIKSRRKAITDAVFAGDFALTDYAVRWYPQEWRSESFRSVEKFAPLKFWMMISG